MKNFFVLITFLMTTAIGLLITGLIHNSPKTETATENYCLINTKENVDEEFFQP